MKINEIFKITYPKTLIYSEMIPDEEGINFVSSQDKNNGIAGRVKIENGIKIYPAGCITVPLKGSVLMAHLQPKPCYVAHQIAVLEPFDTSMSYIEKLYYVTCIRHNSFKYNYGRQADKTLCDIEIPTDNEIMFSKADSLHYKPLSTANKRKGASYVLDIELWKPFKVNELFEVKYGINMKLNTCIEAEDGDPDAINFVARTESNNGVSARVKPVEGKKPQPAGLITCAGGGSVLSTFLQEEPFYSGRDLYLLIPLQPMSKLAKLFCITVLKANKYRYSYGRQANITLPYLELMLPANADGTPDFNSMDSYMKSLPYGDRI